MTLYRGPGGTGSASSDADTTLYQEFLAQTQAARDAALQAEANAEAAEAGVAASAAAAASSASAAASSASSASTSATNAASSASSASTSASNAASSASSASSSASAASTSATNAASSATAAASNASAASTSATNAANSATSASNSASTATTQATNAASSATAAASSATAAQSAQTAAEAARDAALSAYDNFDDRYLGPKASDPTLDNDGNALIAGALYFNTATNVMKVYDGSTWVAAYVSAAGVLLAVNNLSDLSNTATARANLNVPTRTGGDASGTWGINVTGNAATVTNGVYTAGDQTIAGTKTLSSNPILNAGTANGVAYLNGSKVLTSGSSLVFDGTNLGIGTSSTLGNSTVNAVLGFAARNSGATTGYFQTYNSNAGADLKTWRMGGDSSGNFVLQTVNDAYSSATTRLTADASGNLGLGVTPSAWLSGYAPVFENRGGSIVAPNTTQLQLFANAFLNSSVQWVRRNAGFAGYYNIGGGSHEWHIAGSSTAGSTISWTQAMTLDASGRLGIGTTSPAAPLQVRVATNANFTAQNTAGYVQLQAINDAAAAFTRLDIAGSFITLSPNSTEAVRIDSSGNVGIGTSSPSSWGKLAVRGSITSGSENISASFSDAVNSTLNISHKSGLSGIYTDAGLWFGTANTERARIDTSGNLLVGTTDADAGVSTSTAQGVFSLRVGSGVRVTTPNTNANYWNSAGSTGSTTVHVFRRNGSDVGSITVSTNTAYNTTSDYRLKENIQPMTGALAKVAALKPCTYKWKSDGSDGEGFIAHELAEVCPQAVTGEKDAVDEDGNPKYQGIDTSFLVATLTAALQEAVAEINQLKADVAVLKGN